GAAETIASCRRNERHRAVPPHEWPRPRRARDLLRLSAAFAAGADCAPEYASRPPPPHGIPLRPARHGLAPDHPPTTSAPRQDPGDLLLPPGRAPLPLHQLAAGPVR